MPGYESRVSKKEGKKGKKARKTSDNKTKQNKEKEKKKRKKVQERPSRPKKIPHERDSAVTGHIICSISFPLWVIYDIMQKKQMKENNQ